MVIANKDLMAAGQQFTIGVAETDPESGNHIKMKKRRYTVIHHYRHFVLVENELGQRDTVLNVDLMAAGLVHQPYAPVERVGYRRDHIPTGVDRYKKYRKDI